MGILLADIAPAVSLALPEPYATDRVLELDPHKGLEARTGLDHIPAVLNASVGAYTYTADWAGHPSRHLQRFADHTGRGHRVLSHYGWLANYVSMSLPKMDTSTVVLMAWIGDMELSMGYDAGDPSPAPFNFDLTQGAPGLYNARYGGLNGNQFSLRLVQDAYRRVPLVLCFGGVPASGEWFFTHSQTAVTFTVARELFAYIADFGCPTTDPACQIGWYHASVTQMQTYGGGLLYFGIFQPGAMYTLAQMKALSNWAEEKYIGYAIDYEAA